MRRIVRNCFLVVLAILLLLVGLSYTDIPALTPLASYRSEIVDSVSSWWGEVSPPFPYDVVIVAWAGRGAGESVFGWLDVTANRQTELGKTYCLLDTEFVFTALGESYDIPYSLSPEKAEPLIHQVRQRLTNELDLLLRQRDRNEAKMKKLKDDNEEAQVLWWLGEQTGQRILDTAKSGVALESVMDANLAQLEIIERKLRTTVFAADVRLSDLMPLLTCRRAGWIE